MGSESRNESSSDGGNKVQNYIEIESDNAIKVWLKRLTEFDQSNGPILIGIPSEDSETNEGQYAKLAAASVTPLEWEQRHLSDYINALEGRINALLQDSEARQARLEKLEDLLLTEQSAADASQTTLTSQDNSDEISSVTEEESIADSLVSSLTDDDDRLSFRRYLDSSSDGLHDLTKPRLAKLLSRRLAQLFKKEKKRRHQNRVEL